MPITGTKIEGNKIIYTLESDEQVSKIYIKSPVVYLADEITPVSLSLNASLLYSKDIQAKTTTLQDVKNSWFSVNSVNVEEKEKDGQTIKNLIVSITPFNSELPRLPKLVVGNTEYFGNTVHSFDENFNFTSAKFIFSLPEECYNDLESILNNSKLIIKDALFKLSDMQESSNPFDISLEVKR